MAEGSGAVVAAVDPSGGHSGGTGVLDLGSDLGRTSWGHGRARPWRVVGHCSSTYSSQSVSDQIPIPHTMFPESARTTGPRHILSQTDSPAIHPRGPGVLLLPFVA